MNIILCGMPASGKSYLGELTAKKLNRHFIDTDLMILSEYFKLTHQQATCRGIFLQEGEPFFRTLESKVIKDLKNVRYSIIAIGGGTLCTLRNVQILKEMGWLIYLKVPPQLLLSRLINKTPLPCYLDPADIEGSFNILLKKRLPLYEQNCHYFIDATLENLLDGIEKWESSEFKEAYGK